MAVLSEQVRSGFEERFGRAPDGLWFAPGRVNLIGEHVDYAEGLCLPIALAQTTIAAVARRDDDRLRIASLDAAEMVEIDLTRSVPATRAIGRPTLPVCCGP